jgi:hypothetical protein
VPLHRYTEYRIVKSLEVSALQGVFNRDSAGVGPTQSPAASVAGELANRIGIGDKVILVFSDDQRRISVRLMKEGNDLEKGWLSIASPLGQAILGADEGDEIEFPLDGGRRRRALIERVERVRYPRQHGLLCRLVGVV